MPRRANPESSYELQVLVFAPFGKDSALIAGMLQRAGLRVDVMSNPKQLAQAVSQGAGAAVLTEEALNPEAVNELSSVLRAQPAWSDFPLLVLTDGGASTPNSEIAMRARAPLGTLTLLERPLRAATLVSAVDSALRARQRQYEIRRSQELLESKVEQRTSALRRLSARLMRLQDEERRRFARELHDSLGQTLSAAKISISLAARQGSPDPNLEEAEQLLDRAIAETRTISHLLHPPLLDEMGFASAAAWYVEGFGNRSGIQTALHVPADLRRLPRDTEMALFRILQESLTNVHRHSGSRTVEVHLVLHDSGVTLTVRDTGRGIPQKVLEGFQKGGSNLGVGLAGIRERVMELGGALQVESNVSGTLLKATIPVTEGRSTSENPANRLSSSAS
ncbi:MAG TPA: sensor histidine kinase [Terriglobales bacterium]|nr:sensor histidine kinase [Terriglobales bacterium]